MNVKKINEQYQIIRTQKYDAGQYFLHVISFHFFLFFCNFHIKQNTSVVNNLNIKIRKIYENNETKKRAKNTKKDKSQLEVNVGQRYFDRRSTAFPRGPNTVQTRRLDTRLNGSKCGSGSLTLALTRLALAGHGTGSRSGAAGSNELHGKHADPRHLKAKTMPFSNAI